MKLENFMNKKKTKFESNELNPNVILMKQKGPYIFYANFLKFRTRASVPKTNIIPIIMSGLA